MDATQDRLNQLFTFTVDFAKDMLAENGDFFPFGAVVSDAGTVSAEAGQDSGAEMPDAHEVYRVIFERFAGQKPDNAIAAALVANVTIPDEFESPVRDGVRVHLESEGYARFIYVPYEFVTEGEPEVRMHDPFAVEISPSFFPAG
jgi:hypothetical protein